MIKVLQERGFGSLPRFTKTNPMDHVKSIPTTVEDDMTLIRHIRSSQYVVLAQQNKRIVWTVMLERLFLWSYTCQRSLPRKEKDPGSFNLPCYINNVCLENALADLRASISVMPLLTYLNLVGIGKFVFLVDFIILDMPEDVKVPLILERPFLSTAHAKIDVFKRNITLRVGDEKIIFKSVKSASSLIKRSLDPLYGDYIELNELYVPLELRRDQVDDLMPIIEEGEVFLYGGLAGKEINNLVIMEYLVKISKKARILELKRKHLKITVLTSYSRIHQGRYGVFVPALHKKP
ncbi:retrovirus-related pol polyprotein from transposon TNT 1-94 [Tanacetum coccineum]